MSAPEAGWVPGGVQRPDDPLLDGQPAVSAPLQPRLPAGGALVAALGTNIMYLLSSQWAGGHLLGVVGPAEHGPAPPCAGEAGLVVELAADEEAALQDPLPAHTAALQRHLAGGWGM